MNLKASGVTGATHGGSTPSNQPACDGLARLTEAEVAALRIAIDTVVPQDESSGGWEGGVEKLRREHGADFMSWSIPLILEALALLDSAGKRPTRRRRRQ